MVTISAEAYRAITGRLPEQPRTIRYAKMMDDWGEWKEALNEYNKTLGMKDNVTDTARLGKMFRPSKTNQGASVLDQLANTSAGKTLPYMLAGSAMSPWFSQGLLGKVEYPLGALAAVLHPSSTRLSSRITARARRQPPEELKAKAVRLTNLASIG
jgi:hypothetical protein